MQYKLPKDHPVLSFSEALALFSHDPNLHRAILFVLSFSHSVVAPSARNSNIAIPPRPTLETVLQDQHRNLKIDTEYSAQCHVRARRRQQKKIAKHPALANKEIFNGKNTAPPQAEVLTDPETGEIERPMQNCWYCGKVLH